MASPKIPPALHAAVLKLSDEGQGSEDIAQWLWREHKIEISSRQVRSLIRKRRTELADVAKSVVRDELRKFLLPAIRRVAKAGARAKAIRREAKNHGIEGAMLELKAIDRECKTANLLLHYAGLNQPDKGGAAFKVEDVRAGLLKRIELLAQGASDPKDEPPVH
jgi:hypothetical protein